MFVFTAGSWSTTTKPQELMGKILIKNKKKHHHRASNGGSIRRKDGTDEQSSPLNGV